MEQIHHRNCLAIYSLVRLAKVNMAEEKLYCGKCKIHFTIIWDEDESPDFLEPLYCPMCGCELDDYDDSDYNNEYEE